MDLVIECEGSTNHVYLNPDPRRNIQKLIKFQLTDNANIFDTLYLQLELTKDENNVSKEVLDRLAGRDPPFTRLRIRRE